MVAFFFLLSGFYSLAVDFELREVRGGPFGEDSADDAQSGGKMDTAAADRVRALGGFPPASGSQKGLPVPTGLLG